MIVDEPSLDPSEPPKRWQITELTDSAQLRREGAALRHCVASYVYNCSRGVSSIWSLRSWRGEKIRHLLTVEVNQQGRAVVQARGRDNRWPAGKPLEFLRG